MTTTIILVVLFLVMSTENGLSNILTLGLYGFLLWIISAIQEALYWVG